MSVPIKRLPVPLLYSAAAVSGVAALIYQVVWVKMLALPLGSTNAAAAAVIGSFMLGMGIGARVFPMLTRRSRNAFNTYGWLELGIAISSLGACCCYRIGAQWGQSNYSPS